MGFPMEVEAEIHFEEKEEGTEELKELKVEESKNEEEDFEDSASRRVMDFLDINSRVVLEVEKEEREDESILRKFF